MKWMEAEHPADVDILVCECRWQIIPREIDIEAEERFDELDEIYRKITHVLQSSMLYASGKRKGS